MSTGLVPIAQPPGKDTRALPNFDNKGPKTIIPARMVFTKLYGAKVFKDFLELFNNKFFLMTFFCFSVLFVIIIFNFNYSGYLGGGFFYKISNVLRNGDFLMIKGSNATKLHEVSKGFIGGVK